MPLSKKALSLQKWMAMYKITVAELKNRFAGSDEKHKGSWVNGGIWAKARSQATKLDKNFKKIFDELVAVAPAKPTAPVVDDTTNTFNWTFTPGYTALTDYEFTVNGGTSYAAVTSKPITGITGAKAAGQVGVRVKAHSPTPVSQTLFNTVAYTA